VDFQERLMKAMPEEPRRRCSERDDLVRGRGTPGLPVLFSEQYLKGLGPRFRRSWISPGAEPIEKMVFSCAGVERFRTVVETLGRRTFVLAGIENHVCVLQTALDLVEEGYVVFTARDATCSRTRENWEAGNEVMARAGVTISSTEILVFQWLLTASAEEFKDISKLVR
jgi:hypothetical protein